MTNSLQVASVLHGVRRPDLQVILSGGVRTPSDALVGPVAVATLRALHVDMLFLGVHGISVDAGFSTPNLLEGETDQAHLASAERVVVVADHTKWGVRGLSRIARLDEAHVLVTDAGLSPEARGVLAEHIDQLDRCARATRSTRAGRLPGSRGRVTPRTRSRGAGPGKAQPLRAPNRRRDTGAQTYIVASRQARPNLPGSRRARSVPVAWRRRSSTTCAGSRTAGRRCRTDGAR